MKRRDFLKSSLVAYGLTALSPGVTAVAAESTERSKGGERPLIVSTWGFGKPANEVALKTLLKTGSILDAVEQGIWVAESDPGNPSVGLGGMPNAAGVVQLDAAIMLGPGYQAGSVAALEGIRHPISVARRVMEKTSHVMLVGEGARMFALSEGMESVEVNSAERYQAWQEQREGRKSNDSSSQETPGNHDTLALLVLDSHGDMAAGCSTSGRAGKLPGRVGDSPIIGGGLYVDNEVGAAGATGLGENIMRHCGSFLVVEYMRQGLAPWEACLEAIRRISRMDPKGKELRISFVALDKKGRYGAASTGRGFPYAVTTPADSRVLMSAGLGGRDIGPEGGH